MTTPLDPANLTPAASLNRVTIVALPESSLEPDVVGRTAFNLLSSQSIADEIRREAVALGLPAPGADPSRLLPAFDRRLASRAPAVRAAAEGIARRIGRRLGYLLCTLKRGDAANRAAREDWDDSYWSHWASVRTIILGGGIVSGHLGPLLRRHAAAVLAETGTDLSVRLAIHPALLPLVGAARSVPGDAPAAVVLDLGQTAVKRAVAAFDPLALAELRLLPSIPSPRGAEDGAIDDAVRLADEVTAVIAAALREGRGLGDDAAPVIMASIASYLRNGQPLPRPGTGYAALRTVSGNLGRWLAERVSDAVGQSLAIDLVHDGTAAARAFAGKEDAAVITLGTGLGLGFPPPAAGLRPVAATFGVRGDST